MNRTLLNKSQIKKKLIKHKNTTMDQNEIARILLAIRNKLASV